ncbi:MAG: hypothetical protein KJZ85_18885 [Rhodobacteraceae bacterium]|jgi:hypothetical protein|nr:hypothetical protein [Paracoccaceae bacterium]
MARHIADRPRSGAEGARLARYLDAARRETETPHPAARTLHRRPGERDPANRRAQEFIRIDRGRSV